MARRHRRRNADEPLAPFVLGAPNTSPQYTERIRRAAIEHGLDPDEAVREFRAATVLHNGTYTVFVRDDVSPIDGNTYTHLSIKRDDREMIDDFRVFQRIKNAIVGREREAVQVYPAESALVDTSNQYHLWVYPEGYVRPYCFFARYVSDDTRFGGTKQRRFAQDVARIARS